MTHKLLFAGTFQLVATYDDADRPVNEKAYIVIGTSYHYNDRSHGMIAHQHLGL